jgi:hypothetical protein
MGEKTIMKAGGMELMKFRRLMRRLGESKRGIVGLLECLWYSAAHDCPAGDVGKFTNEEIAIMCDWSGDPDELVAALVASGYLDEHELHRLVIHDWHVHCPNWVRGILARHGRQFANGEPSNRKEAAADNSQRGSMAAAAGGRLSNQYSVLSTECSSESAANFNDHAAAGNTVFASITPDRPDCQSNGEKRLVEISGAAGNTVFASITADRPDCQSNGDKRLAEISGKAPKEATIGTSSKEPPIGTSSGEPTIKSSQVKSSQVYLVKSQTVASHSADTQPSLTSLTRDFSSVWLDLTADFLRELGRVPPGQDVRFVTQLAWLVARGRQIAPQVRSAINAVRCVSVHPRAPCAYLRVVLAESLGGEQQLRVLLKECPTREACEAITRLALEANLPIRIVAPSIRLRSDFDEERARQKLAADLERLAAG